MTLAAPALRARRRAARLGLPTFFLLTFALTWTAWVAPSAWMSPPYAGVFALGGPVFRE